MRFEAVSFGVLLAVGVCAACGGKSLAAVAPTDTSSGGTGGQSSRRDAGSGIVTWLDGSVHDAAVSTVDGGDTSTGPGPVVRITSPVATTDPQSGNVVTTPQVTVHCKVTRSPSTSASDVDSSSVRISTPALDPMMPAATPPVMAVSASEYVATFDLSAYPNGPISFRCEAKDVAKAPAVPNLGFNTQHTLLDLGPKVTIVQPRDGAITALTSPTVVQFKVAAAPLTTGDKQAAVTAVHLVAAGVAIKVSPSKTDPTFYQTSINFQDATLFGTVVPTSAQLVISASDARKPQAVTRQVQVGVTIDGAGPTLVVVSPANQQIVRGDVALRVMASDPAGISLSSLVGDINHGLARLTNWKLDAGQYATTFDTRALDPSNSLTQLTINVTGADTVGNKSTVSLIVRLDNVPPVVSLDPPPIREFTVANGKNTCSEAFDPVGGYAQSDQSTAPALSIYRALVEDRTNHAPGAYFNYLADVNPQSVVLYVQPDPTIALLIDTNHDGVCDEINDVKQNPPPASLPVQQALSALPPAGVAWYAPNLDFTADPKNVPAIGCNSGTAAQPAKLCPVSDMWRVVPGRLTNRPPAVYAFGPNSNECDGTTWNVASFVGTGWRCLAARAEDNIGNIGVSRPIRVCFNDSADCAGMPLPTCTDGCSLPPDFLRDEVWPQQ
ncbi:MAG TPA: hypothetical protein VF331_13175 [Polyangiales bacterium]